MNSFFKLKNICTRITDGSHYSPIGTDKGFPMLSVKDMRENGFDYSNCKFISNQDYNTLVRNDCKPLLNDVLIAKDGSYLKHVFVVKNEINQAILSSIGILRPDLNLINPHYLKYYLQTKSVKETVAKKYVSGSALPRIILKNFGEIDILKPDLSTQQKIASVLSALDDKIELNNNINIELEQMAKTIYDYWFVQFDFPNEDGKPYKSSGGKMVYNEVLKREIPTKWEISVFNNWIENTKTGDWGKDKIEGNYTERVYCIRGADINGLNGKGEVKAPERFILKNNLSKKLQPNDFIIEISGGSPTQSTARIALLTKESFERFDTNVVCSNFCKAITLKDETYVYNFQQEWQRLYDAGIFFGYEGKTSGIKNFLFESFMDSYFVVEPPKELVLKFNSFAKEIERKRQLNLKQNQELSNLRDWLLPMLMNGQVKVVD
ncbi:restriction endonuclease subunit S [Elizabethkingia meningoseptica]|uniref:restriction endonuclease subunit S n=1 Tax=Elizabethkingia meningoseptica TaxID=238 RepID=UPI000998F270|nr:restriction endonuclease subunit S [Elizabethkingia meningoseptica]